MPAGYDAPQPEASIGKGSAFPKPLARLGGDEEFRARSGGGEQALQIPAAERDAAGRRPEAGPADMQENGAAPAADARRKIPVEHADDVVEVVLAPQPVVGAIGGQPDRPVIA